MALAGTQPDAQETVQPPPVLGLGHSAGSTGTTPLGVGKPNRGWLHPDHLFAQDGINYASEDRVIITYEMPLGEVLFDFYDRLKSATKGYASMDYDLIGYRPNKLVKLDLLVNGADACGRGGEGGYCCDGSRPAADLWRMLCDHLCRRGG